MKNNKELLTEFFARNKKGYTDRLLQNVDKYNANPQQSFYTKDSREMKNRLQRTLGATISRNTVKSVASRSIKSFPIIISDNVEPETSVMLKQMLEEQYAEYIAAAVSNMIIDLGDYESDPDKGNIAIQALDQITGVEFDKEQTAHRMAQRGFDLDDTMRNFAAFQLLRRESKEFDTGDDILNTLLENAIIVENDEDVDFVKQILIENEYEIISEAAIPRKNDASLGIQLPGNITRDNIESLGLTGPMNKSQVADILNDNVASLLRDSGNEHIKDRFTKATFLLHTRRISGKEYSRYLINRLGIPVTYHAMDKLIKDYPWNKLTNANPNSVPKHIIDAVHSGDVLGTDRVIHQVLSPTGWQIAKAAGVGGVTGAGAAAGAAAIKGTGVAAALAAASIPLWVAVLGAAGLTGASAALIRRLFKTHKRTIVRAKGEGWERVEALINEMYSREEDLKGSEMKIEYNDDGSIKSVLSAIDDRAIETETQEYKAKMDNLLIRMEKELKDIDNRHKETRVSDLKFIFEGQLDRVLADIDQDPVFYVEDYDHEDLENRIRIINDELGNNKEYQATLKENMISANIHKDLISTTVPIKVLRKYEFDPKDIPDVQVVPDFAMKGLQAYGEVEYDKRNLKDRKYNTPLLMTIKFKERFGDDRFSDKELTAVIGILGVVTRIPSEEMEYILKTNAEGKTVAGIFGTKDKNINVIDDLIGLKKTKELDEKAPNSKEVWANLEKVGRLAIANKFTGKRTGNVANAQIIFSQREVDNVKADGFADLLKSRDLAENLLKRYSALSIMVANDIGERLFIYDTPGMPSWEVVPYSALRGKEAGDQLGALAAKLNNYGGR